MNELVRNITDDEFTAHVSNADKPVLVDFWAEWCGPCRILAPTVDAIAEIYKDRVGVFKMNVDENPRVPQELGVRGIPTLVVYKGGFEQERIVGAVTHAAISRLIEKYV